MRFPTRLTWAPVLLGLLAGLTVAYFGGVEFGVKVASAQDSVGTNSDPAPTTGAAIETGSVFGPIVYGMTGATATIDPPYLSTHYDDDPLEGSLNVPPGRATCITFRRFVGYTSGTSAVTLTSIEASEIWAVEKDATPELGNIQTTRLYLRSGGYIIARGRADGPRGFMVRWMEARGLGEMPATVALPEAK